MTTTRGRGTPQPRAPQDPLSQDPLSQDPLSQDPLSQDPLSQDPLRQGDAARVRAAVTLLPHVTAERPAAVLLVDLAQRQVLFANPLAEQLAPGLALPAPVDAWAGAAELLDLGGRPLEESHPLSQVAQGQPVAGQGVSARRSSDVSAEREPLWVVAVPLHGAPVLDHCALVVLLPLHDVEALPDELPGAAGAGQEAQRQVRERAVLATGLAFTVVDARAEDQPLVWVNPAFTATTGYGFEEVVGRNCRFLQGPATDRADVRRLRAALAAGEPSTTTLLNYRKDGTAFWNQLSISPVLDGAGTLTHFVGIQIDVTEKRAAELERERALAAERAARAESERARGGLALLAEATRRLSATLDPERALEELAALVLPDTADWVVIDLLDDDGLVQQVTARHAEGRAELVERYRVLQPARLGPESPVTRVLQTGQPELLTALDPARQLPWYDGDDELQSIVAELGMRSAVVVPLLARRRVLGSLALVTTSRDYDDEDLLLAADLGRRAALMLDNARLYQREHDAAVLLQRSLLPDLPQVPGVTVAARYLAGDTAAQVGGDFYEVLRLPGGAIGLAVGDVVGHDLAAAAAMGHLRGLLRACAYDTALGGATDGGSPATVLARVDRLVQGLHVAPLATVLYARLDRLPDGSGWQVACSSAGHPPLVLRGPDGRARLLEVAPDVLLGVLPDAERSVRLTRVEPGSTLLAYTDGLVERRDADLDEGLARLLAAVEAAPAGAAPEELVELLTAGLAGAEDDVALLALRLDA